SRSPAPAILRSRRACRKKKGKPRGTKRPQQPSRPPGPSCSIVLGKALGRSSPPAVAGEAENAEGKERQRAGHHRAISVLLGDERPVFLTFFRGILPAGTTSFPYLLRPDSWPSGVY